MLFDDKLMKYGIHLMYDFHDRTPVSELRCDARFELLDAENNVLAGTLGGGETVEWQTLLDITWYVRAFYVSEGEYLRVESDYYNPYPDPEPTPRPVPSSAPETQDSEPEGTRICYLRMSWTDRCSEEHFGETGSFSLQDGKLHWTNDQTGEDTVFVRA